MVSWTGGEGGSVSPRLPFLTSDEDDAADSRRGYLALNESETGPLWTNDHAQDLPDFWYETRSERLKRDYRPHVPQLLKVAANGEGLMGLMTGEPKLVIVDLNARNEPIAAIEKLRQARKDIRVVGFLSHVQRGLAAQAQAAGCDEVMPRSSFTQNLAAILSQAKD